MFEKQIKRLKTIPTAITTVFLSIENLDLTRLRIIWL